MTLVVVALFAALTAAAPAVVATAAGAAAPAAVIAAGSAPVSDAGKAVVTAPGTAVGVDHRALAERARASNQPVELTDLRTAASVTKVAPDGLLETQASAAPVNFRGTDGAWQPIVTALVPDPNAGFAFKNTAGAELIEFPANLHDGGVRVTRGGLWVQFALTGAAASVATVAGDTITYAAVWPGVDVRYQVTSAGVKESLVLASATATPSFTASITASPGATLQAVGTDQLVSNGTDQLRIAAPFAQTADPQDRTGQTGAVSMAVARIGNAWQAITAVTPAWLADPTRKFPVVIDPTVTDATIPADCVVASGSYATTEQCTLIGSNVGNVYTVRGRKLLQPDLSAVPLDATVVTADLQMYATTSSGGSLPVEAHQVTKKWNTAHTTWTNADNVIPTAWTTAGGDFAATAEATTTVTTTGQAYTWSIPKMTQAWVTDPAHTAFGVEFKTTNDAVAGYVTFGAYGAPAGQQPSLVVRWTPRVGAQGFEKFWTQSLSDHSDVSVNLATGNLVVDATDFHESGVGVDMTIDRSYNSRAAFAGSTGPAGFATHRLGTGWTMGTANDVWLAPINATGSGTRTVLFHGPTGIEVPFTSTSLTGPWTAPGQNATLTRVPGTTSYWYLLFNRTGITDKFFDTGAFGSSPLYSVADRNGLTMSITDAVSGFATTSITGTYGVVATFNTTAGYLSSIGLSTGRTYSYGLDPTSHKLTTFTDPTAGNPITTYHYDPTSGLLDYIDTPQDATHTYRTGFAYDAIGRVTQVSRYTDTAHTVALSTQFGYAAPFVATAPATGQATTVVTNPKSNVWTYSTDPALRVIQTAQPGGTCVTLPLVLCSYRVINANNDADSFTSMLGAPTNLAYTSTYNSLNSVKTPGTDNTTQVETKLTYAGTGSFGHYEPDTAIDPQGHTTTYTYDANGNLASSIKGTTGTTYSINGTNGACANAKTGQLCSVTDGRGYTTAFTYDAVNVGHVKTITPAGTTNPPTATGPTGLTYDSDSRAATVTDGKAQKSTYSYDNRDRVTQILYNGTSTCVAATCTTFAYDYAGNLVSRVDNTGTTTTGYDALSRPATKTFPGTVTAASTFDGDSNLTSLTENGYTTTYTYNTVDLVTGLAEPTGSCTGTISLCTTFAYDGDLHRTLTTYPNGVTTTVVPGPSGRPTRVTTVHGVTPISDLSYTYYATGSTGPDGELSHTVTDNATHYTTTYGYDTVNRLQDASTNTSGSVLVKDYGYTYDNAGNLTSAAVTVPGPVTTATYYAYDPQNRLCITAITSGPTCPTSSFPYTYDADGNQLTGDGHTLAYNTKNQTTTEDAIADTYAGTGQTDRTAHGTPTFTNWLLGPGTKTVGAITRYYGRTPGGQLVATSTSTTHDYYVFDGQNNVIGLTNSSGTVAATYTYDPYGGHAANTGPDAAYNYFRYKSGYTDVDTSGGDQGLVKYGDRYYDPTIARWTQPDPLAGGTTNPSPYPYAGDNPVDRSDPSGDVSEECNIVWCSYYLDRNETTILKDGLATGAGAAGLATVALALSVGGAPAALITGLIAALAGIDSAVIGDILDSGNCPNIESAGFIDGVHSC